MTPLPHLYHGFQRSPILNRQPYKGRKVASDWWRNIMETKLEVGSGGQLVCDPTMRQPGFDLPRQLWSLVNRFHTEKGHCGTCRRKLRLTLSFFCDETQTMSHIVESCPLTKLNGGLPRPHCTDEDANFPGWPTMVYDTHTRKRRLLLSGERW